MVASITLPSGNLPDLSTAIFASSDSAQAPSLFDALFAAAAQGDDSSVGQEVPAPVGVLPVATVAIPAAWQFALPLPAIPSANSAFGLNEALASGPKHDDQLPEPAQSNSQVPELPFAPRAFATVASSGIEDLLPSQPPAAFSAPLPTDSEPVSSTETPVQLPALPAEDIEARPPPSHARPEEATEKPATNTLPAQIRFALANIPGAPALIVRNLIIAQLPPQAQGDEHAAPAPAANEHSAQPDDGDGAQISTSMPNPLSPEPQASLAIVLAQLPEPTAPAPSSDSAEEPTPKPASSEGKRASASPVKAADDQQTITAKDDSISAVPDTLAENTIVFATAPPPVPPIAFDSEPIPAIALEANMRSSDKSAAPQIPDANSAPTSNAGAAPSLEPPQTASAASEISSAAVTTPQQSSAGLRIANVANQRNKGVIAPQVELPPLAETAAKPVAGSNAVPTINAPPSRANPESDTAASSPTAAQSGEMTSAADAPTSAPKAKPEHAAQPMPEPRANAGPSPPAIPQIAAASQTAAGPHASFETPPTPVTAGWVPAAGDLADAPVRVSYSALAGSSDTAMLDALALKIAARSSDGDANFQIRLDPPELGRIEVNLNVDSNGNAQASLTADKPQTLDLLQRDSGTLERALRDAGLDLTGGLSFSLKSDTRSGAWRDAQNGRGRALSIGAIETIAAGTIGPVSPVLYGYGANGRLDITV